MGTFTSGTFCGQMFLIVVDTSSKWLKVVPLAAANSTNTIDDLRNMFATHGLPKMIVSNNGSHFTSDEFQAFMKTNAIKLVCSSLYPNSLAERIHEATRRFRESALGIISVLVSTYNTYNNLVALAELLLERHPRSLLDFLIPSLADNVHK